MAEKLHLDTGQGKPTVTGLRRLRYLRSKFEQRSVQGVIRDLNKRVTENERGGG